MSNIKQTKEGLVEKTSGRKIESPLDINPGDVVFSKRDNCKVTVNTVTNKGILCDWFTDTQLHRELISENELQLLQPVSSS